jgi:putative FmdB family regulatory protein
MPTYEYACTNCGQHVEVYQRFSEAPLTTCGVCGGPLRKVFHPVGIVFKGPGFYATDSRAKAGSKDGESSGGAKETSGGSKSSDTPKEASSTSAGSDGTAKKKAEPSAAKERSA